MTVDDCDCDGDGDTLSRESACRSYGKRKRGRWWKSRPSTLDLGQMMIAKYGSEEAARYDSVTWKLQKQRRFNHVNHATISTYPISGDKACVRKYYKVVCYEAPKTRSFLSLGLAPSPSLGDLHGTRQNQGMTPLTQVLLPATVAYCCCLPASPCWQ